MCASSRRRSPFRRSATERARARRNRSASRGIPVTARPRGEPAPTGTPPPGSARPALFRRLGDPAALLPAAVFAWGALPAAFRAAEGASSPAPARAASAPTEPNAGRGTADAEAMRQIFAEFDRPDSPGCAAGALRDGEFLFRGAFGSADLDHRIPLTPDSIFRLASVSKQFTAAAVLVAEDRGLLSLEDPLRRHFPDLPGWADPVRVRHLVHHTSGIRDYLTVMALAGYGDDDHYTDAEVLASLRRLERLNFPPGSEYLYSNSGYWLLGQLVRRVSGQTLREFAAEHLFGPLGMRRTHFHDRHREVVPTRATGYRRRPEEQGGGFEEDETTLEMVGDGGLYTSVNELRHWERLFLDPGGFGPGFVERLTAPGRLADGALQDYAGGLTRGRYRGLETISHGGGFVGFRTYSLRFPGPRFSVFVLCNAARARPGLLARRVADHFLADRSAPPPAEASGTPATAANTPVAPGRFWEPASASLLEIREATPAEVEAGAAAEGLRLDLGGRALPLTLPEPGGEGSDGSSGGLLANGEDEGVTLRLDPGLPSEGASGGDGFTLREAGQRDFRYRRVAPAEPDLERLTGLAGAYRCRELGGVTYEVRLDARPGLRLAQGTESRPLEPGFVEETPAGDAIVFSWPGGTIRFLPDPAAGEAGPGRALGFDLSVGRARGFRFRRD